MTPESPPPAPAVVAVVVTCDPGSWFEEVLTSLAAQDYPNLSVLVVDAGSSVDPTPAVAQVLPGAFVRLLEKRVGFGTAANEVLGIVDGASHFLFCHDDVALAPDAVSLMVEEAFRSNAGVVSPKYVMWDDAERLVAVGATTDKVGALRSVVDPGELDQEQHDSVRDVLVAPGGATLIRADLFAALGGFDPVVDQDGEDLNFSWRVRIAGARVVVAPAARVRHLEATRSGARSGRLPSMAARRAVRRWDVHRYRTLLMCYRWYTLAWVVPLAVFWALGEAVTLTVQGRGSDGWVTVTALGGALRQGGQLRRARRKVQRSRQVGDSAIRQLQVRGNTRLRLFLQSRVEGVRTSLPHARPARVRYDPRDPEALEPVVAPRPVEGNVTREANPAWRLNLLLGLVLVLVLAVGTRSLLGHELPQVGRLPYTSGGWSQIWHHWWSAWQPSGLGTAGPSSPALALLGLAATVLFGAVGTLQHLVVLGPLLVGPFGAYRAARHWGSGRGQITAAIAYAVVPLPYNALARGHWDGLVAYAAMPWVLGGLVRLAGLIPLPAVSPGRLGGRLVGLGLVVAATASVAPSFLYLVLIVGLALFAGSLLAGRPSTGLRLLGLAAVATLVAFLVLLPWSASVITHGASLSGPDLGGSGRLGLGQVLGFQTGPFGGPGGWLVLAAAALPLFVGREWRLEWAARFWLVALVGFALAWAGRRGWIPAFPIEVALVPTAAALAASAALGAAAFELDLPGYRFGWRQAAAGVAAMALAVASVPLLAQAGNGRWHLPRADAASVLTVLPDSQDGDYRILWAGAPDAIPMASRALEPGFGYATSFDGPPGLAYDWLPGPTGSAPQLASALRLVQDRLTTKLGHLLGPTGVRYIVVPNHTGPSGSGAAAVAVPGALVAGLGLQTDLHVLPGGDANYLVYENSAWVPVRATVPDSEVSALAAFGPGGLRAVQDADLSGARPALTGGSATAASGTVAPGSTVYVAADRASGWRLSAEGVRIRPQPAFGWAMAFQVPFGNQPGRAHLAYGASFGFRAAQIGEILLWGVAVGFVLIDFRRRQRSAPLEVPDPEWFVPLSPQAPRRRPGDGAAPATVGDLTGEEVWTDV